MRDVSDCETLTPARAEGLADRPGLTTVVLIGEPATAALRDASFRQEWEQLHASCPWATVCQGPAFNDAWWSVYSALYEPVVVAVRTIERELCGLLLLARKVGSTEEVVHVGGHQAEYHTWLALPWASDAVITGALRELDARRLAQRLRFHFLAPGSPVAWINGYQGAISPVCIVRSHRRGLLKLASETHDRDSLRKPSNRSKLRRLARGGILSLEVLRSAAELEPWLARIAAMCDARQGAVNQSLPFRDDPRKARFHRALADYAGLAHVSVLLSGGELLAAHIGLIDGSTVLLGLIAHAPQHGRDSPGKMLLLMLAQRLAKDGFSTFDFTPGGSYKERFANMFDDVLSLDVRFTAAEALVQSARRTAGTLVRRMLPARNERTAPRTTWSQHDGEVYLRDCGGGELLLHAWRSNLEAVKAQFGIRVNDVGDLLRFGGPDVPRSEMLRFLPPAIARMEAGDTLVTVSDTRELVHLVWLRRWQPSMAPNNPDALPAISGPLLLIEQGFSSIRSTDAMVGGAAAAGILALAPVPDESFAVLYRIPKSALRNDTALATLGFTRLSKQSDAEWSHKLALIELHRPRTDETE